MSKPKKQKKYKSITIEGIKYTTAQFYKKMDKIDTIQRTKIFNITEILYFSDLYQYNTVRMVVKRYNNDISEISGYSIKLSDGKINKLKRNTIINRVLK